MSYETEQFVKLLTGSTQSHGRSQPPLRRTTGVIGAINSDGSGTIVLDGDPAATQTPFVPVLPVSWAVGEAVECLVGTGQVDRVLVTGRVPQVDSLWHTVGNSGEPAFQNGWVNATGPAVQFRRIDKAVYLRGTTDSGTLNSTIFTLPAGYIPLANTVQVTWGSSVAPCVNAIQVDTSGNVSPPVEAADPIWLDGVVFFVD